MSFLATRALRMVTDLASCLCREIEEQAEAGLVQPVCSCMILPGNEVPFDYCEDGQAWARLVSIVPVEGDRIPQACVAQWDITIEVGILRCAPMLGEDGELPPLSENIDSATAQIADLGIMHKVLTCCQMEGAPPVTLREYVPVGPDGGCLGGVWHATWRVE